MLLYALLGVLAAAAIAHQPTTLDKPSDDEVAKYIVGGQYVRDKYKWPSMCSLQEGTWHYCGASLIAPQWVITAAHCVEPFQKHQMVVVCGVTNFWDRTWGAMEVHQIASWSMHKNHLNDFDLGYANDLAVIKLTHPVNPYNPYIKPTPLIEDDGFNWEGSECWATGWGKTGNWHQPSSLLRDAKMDIITYKQCQELWGKSALKSHICAKDLANSENGACNGDSGGPLYCKRNDEWFQVAVFSWMAGNCDPYWPSMYASVAHYREWIAEHTEGL